MISIAPIAGRLTAEHTSGTATLRGEEQAVGSDERDAPPPLHFPCTLPHVHALQPRVSANAVPITTLVLL
jgi:hypothetical protein